MMTPWNNSDSGVCRDTRAMLSDYIDNALCARQVWEVEKHLAACKACGDEARQLQSTVQILRAAPRFDTGDRFMASLHARLDGLDVAQSGNRPWDWLRTWFSGGPIRRAGIPVLSVGLASAALALMFVVNRPQPRPLTPAATLTASEGVHFSVASSANNPFSDPAADNLQYRSTAQEGGRPSTTL